MPTNPYKPPDHSALNRSRRGLSRGYLFANLGTLAVWMLGLVLAWPWFVAVRSKGQVVFSFPLERAGTSPELGRFASYDPEYWMNWEGALLMVVILVLISLAIVNAIVWFWRFRALKRV